MEINSGNYPNGNFQPLLVGTDFTGPLFFGNITNTSGTTLAPVGAVNASGGYIANAGFAVGVQVARITQASAAGTQIVIPAQSQILSMSLMVETAWTGGATTGGVGSTASATAFTGTTAVQGSTLGLVTITPGTGATQIGNWVNVGNTDVQLIFTSGNTGSGVGVLTVTYAMGINTPTT